PRAVVDDEISDAPGRAREEHPLEPGGVLLHEVGRGMRRARQGVVDSLARIEPLRRLDGAVTPLRGALARCLVAESLVAILDRFASARLGGSFRLRLGRVRRGECLTCLLAGAAGATRLFLLLGHRRLYTTSDAVGDKPLVTSFWLPWLRWWRRELVGQGNEGEGLDLDVLIREQREGERVPGPGSPGVGQGDRHLGGALRPDATPAGSVLGGRDAHFKCFLTVDCWAISEPYLRILRVARRGLGASLVVDDAPFGAPRASPHHQPHARAVPSRRHVQVRHHPRVGEGADAPELLALGPTDVVEDVCLLRVGEPVLERIGDAQEADQR